MSKTAPEPKIFATGQIVAGVLDIFIRRMPKIALLTIPGVLGGAGVVMLYTMFVDAPLRAVVGGGVLDRILPILFLGALAGIATGIQAGAMAAAWRSYTTRRRVDLDDCLRLMQTRTAQTVLAAMLVGIAIVLPWAALSFATNAGANMVLGAGALALGMYAISLWGIGVAMIPAEELGLVTAFRRARRLSQGYRWQIAGAAFLLLCAAILMCVMLGICVAFGSQMLQHWAGITASLNGPVATTVGLGVIGFPIVAIMPLGLAAMRARLIEIKEPPDIGDMTDVFD